MNNKHYFQYSQNNPDSILDLSKQSGFLVISPDKEQPDTPLMKANHRLIDLITTYSTLSESKYNDKTILEKIINDVIDLIENTKLINYSAFCTYFQVIGYSYNSYCLEKNRMTRQEKQSLMRTLLDLYIKNRHSMYLSHGYSDQVLQIGSDTASSRRKGKTGIEMIESILMPLGFKKANNLNELNNTNLAYILPDKGQKDVFDTLLKQKNIKFEFRESRDAKNPDMLFKIKNDLFILEHKLTNGGGGSQNAEINEIIQFINYSESEDGVHYVSCLAGDYFKKLVPTNREPKVYSQYTNINRNLNAHPHNYFVNGNGLEELIKNYVKAYSGSIAA